MFDTGKITKYNLARMLKALREALEGATYVALDCEMTGLFAENNNSSWFDSAPDRYVYK